MKPSTQDQIQGGVRELQVTGLWGPISSYRLSAR